MNVHYAQKVNSLISDAMEQAKSVGQLRHQGLKGRAREIFIQKFLSPFLNHDVGVCTGVIVDSDNNCSKQVDIIVYDKNLIPPVMLSESDGIVPVESVLCAMEIKSKLTVAEWRKAVNNARSIKLLRQKFREIDQSGREAFFYASKSSVFCALFSYSSDKAGEAELKRMRSVVDAINSKEKVPVFIPLSAVCVGDSVAISCLGYEGMGPIIKPIFSESFDRAALTFISFVVDQITVMQCQKRKMLMSHYFF